MNRLNHQKIKMQGVQLIEASAGTGKTYTLTNLVLQLLLDPDKPLPLPKILLVSFTEASTAELFDRVSSRLQVALTGMENPDFASKEDPFLTQWVQQAWRTGRGDLATKQLRLALRSLDEASILTIHGFCSSVLKQFAFDAGQPFSATFVKDVSLIAQVCIADFWAKETYGMDSFHLNLLTKHKITLSALSKLYFAVSNHSALEIRSDPKPSPLDLETYNKVKRELLQVWDPNQVADCFESATRLNKRSYSAQRITKAVKETDLWLKAPDFNPDPPSLMEILGKQKIASSLKKTGSLPEHPSIQRIDPLIEKFEELEVYGDRWISYFLHSFLAELPKQVKKIKIQRRELYFQDLLAHLDLALKSGQRERLIQAVGDRFQVALIDEFQDTDQMQYQIFKTIFDRPGSGLFLIGDPKQAIYSFRGGDIFTYAEAKRDATQTWGLVQNWRSDAGQVKSVNHLFGHKKNPFFVDFIPYTPISSAQPSRLFVREQPEQPMVLHYTQKGDQPHHSKDESRIQTRWAEEHLPHQVATDVVKLLNGPTTILEQGQSRAVGPQDLAVLVRTNKQADSILSALQDRSVPAVFQARSPLFGSVMAKQLLRFLTALLNSTDTDSMRLALTGAFFGISTTQITDLINKPTELTEWVRRFDLWSELWVTRGFSRMLNHWLAQVSVGSNLLSTPNGKQHWSSLRELIQLLVNESRTVSRKPHQLVAFLESQIKEPGKLELFEPELNEEPAVTILTIHKSKGLEFPICFLPFMWTSKVPGKRQKTLIQPFHQLTPPHQPQLDLRSQEGHRFEIHSEALSEDLRLLYVALTRAKHQNHLYFGPFGPWEESAFWFLVGSDAENLSFPACKQTLQSPYHRLNHDFKGYRCDELLEKINVFFEPINGLVRLQDSTIDSNLWEGQTPKTAAQLKPWVFDRSLTPFFRIGSYSALVRGVQGPVRATPSCESGQNTELKRIDLAQFPKGPQAGLFFHHLLEIVDPASQDPNRLNSQITESARRYRFDDEKWAEPLQNWTHKLLSQPLLKGLALADLSPQQRLVEVEFMLCLKEKQQVTAAKLASAFMQPELKQVAAQVGRLEFPALEGFLTGFIDLIFEHEGKVYLVDYKSNHLGPFEQDYHPEALEAQMVEHHYHLQAWLYSLAVHRYLQLKLPNYDYEKQFGGCIYLFIRAAGSVGGGLVHCRPDWQEIQQLDQLFTGPT